MERVEPIYISNEPESQENPTYVVSRLINTPQEEEVEIVQEDRPTFIAFKAEEGGEAGGAASNDNTSS
jgi:hypothetical protein